MKLTIFGYGFEDDAQQEIVVGPLDTVFIDDALRVHHFRVSSGERMMLAFRQPIETLTIGTDHGSIPRPDSINYWIRPVAWADLPTVLAPLVVAPAADSAEPPPPDNDEGDERFDAAIAEAEHDVGEDALLRDEARAYDRSDGRVP